MDSVWLKMQEQGEAAEFLIVTYSEQGRRARARPQESPVSIKCEHNTWWYVSPSGSTPVKLITTLKMEYYPQSTD